VRSLRGIILAATDASAITDEAYFIVLDLFLQFPGTLCIIAFSIMAYHWYAIPCQLTHP
jgi:hypothetical protein